MKILIVSEQFFPSVGGVETVTRLLGKALIHDGHQVTIVTNTPGLPPSPRGLTLFRHPRPFSLIKLYRTSDAIILQGSTLRLGWPLLLRRSDAVMVHHLRIASERNPATRRLRSRLTRRVRHAAVSHDLARALPWPVQTVLPNPYDDTVFRRDPSDTRTRDIICVARLIPEKGGQVLIQALSRLTSIGRPVTATLVGEGPERGVLEKLVADQDLDSSVRLAGQVSGVALARLLRQHRILVVPSIQPEGFGLVALEAIACGCIVVGTNHGGLPEAIGPCGLKRPANDSEALAATLQDLLNSTDELDGYLSKADQHLAPHRPHAVAQRYLEFILGNRVSNGTSDRIPEEIKKTGTRFLFSCFP